MKIIIGITVLVAFLAIVLIGLQAREHRNQIKQVDNAKWFKDRFRSTFFELAYQNNYYPVLGTVSLYLETEDKFNTDFRLSLSTERDFSEADLKKSLNLIKMVFWNLNTEEDNPFVGENLKLTTEIKAPNNVRFHETLDIQVHKIRVSEW